MAVLFKIYQGTNSHVGTAGKWYARAAVMNSVGIDELAEAIQEKCTVHAADVIAVIKALISEMTRNLQDSKRVVLDGFGSFKVGLSSEGADTVKDFKVSKNITGMHVIFQPAATYDRSTKKHTKTLLKGAELQEYGEYSKKTGA